MRRISSINITKLDKLYISTSIVQVFTFGYIYKLNKDNRERHHDMVKKHEDEKFDMYNIVWDRIIGTVEKVENNEARINTLEEQYNDRRNY